MANYQLLINDVAYSRDFEFVANPAIELKKDDNERVIYENPSFNFFAYNELKDDLETLIEANPICLSIDCKVVRNEEIIWLGKIKTSDITHNYYSLDKGNYKEVEIIDNNYKCYFKALSKVDLDVESPYDLDCNVLAERLLPTQINFFLSSTMDDYPRKTFKVYELLKHMVLLISKGEVEFESEYFTIGEGKDLAIALGEWISLESSINAMTLNWTDLTRDLFRYYNLWSSYYIDGVTSKIRIESYDYFFSTNEFSNIENVSDLKVSSKLDKLYSSVKIGDGSKVNDFDEANYVDFQLDTFREKSIDVSNDCSFDSELDLTGRILYDSDKIEYSILKADTEEQYFDRLFLIETDGENAIKYTRGNTEFYNRGLLNSKILRRYFDGVSPISVYPESFNGVDYFQVKNTSIISYGKIIVGGGENIQLDRLAYYGDAIQFDSDGVISTVNSTHSINGVLSSAVNATQFTASSSGSRKFYCNFRVAVFNGTVSSSPQLRVNVRINDVSAGTFTDIESDYQVVEMNGGITNLEFETDSIVLDTNDTVLVWIESTNIFAVSGVVTYAFDVNSTFGVFGCSNYESEFIADSVKQLKYESIFDGYPINKTDFDYIRQQPYQVLNVNSGEYIIRGFIESFKYDYETSATNVKLLSNKGANKNT